MYAFRLSHPHFQADALQSAVNTMAERGIRLRAMHSLDSYLVNQENSGTDEGDEDWGEAEIEHKSSELARLKPY